MPRTCLYLHGVSAFVTERGLMTVHDRAFLLDGLTTRWDQAPDVVRDGVGGLLHGLLDLVVDSHFEAIERLDDAVDDVEDELFEDHAGKRLQQQMSMLRKTLVQLRRVVLPMREVLNTLMRRDLHVVTADLTMNYQDVYDRALRASSGPRRCATWSAPSSRRTCRCRTTGSATS